MFGQLIWKDLRNQSGVLLLGFFFLVGPYGMYLIDDREGTALPACVIFSLIASLMTIVVMGATIIGSERQHHGMDFLLSLPVSRSKSLLSKSIVCVFVFAIIWGSAFQIVGSIRDQESQRTVYVFLAGTAAIGLALFGVAWLCSVIFRGFAIPISAGLIVAGLLLFIAVRYAGMQDWDSDSYQQKLGEIYFPACAIVGMVSFIVGWIAFLRKREP